MFSFFKPKIRSKTPALYADIHSHLLPGLDDGVKTWEESLSIISQMKKMGYSKLVVTPHIMTDFYRNDPEVICQKAEELRNLLAKEKINIQLEAAAEYYLDEFLFQSIHQQPKLLTFGKNYLLFETNFITEPFQMKEFIFSISTMGYIPVLAHPERYQYMTLKKAEDLKDRGVLFQINLPSLVGYYSKPIQVMAHKLIDKGWVDFLGSDCHNENFIPLIKDAQQHRYYKKAMELPLLNRHL